MGASTLKAYNTFVRGIITEAGPLTFPENASLDEENTVLNRDGSRQRRLGMDLEEDFVFRAVTLTENDAISSALWTNVANDPERDFVVVQIGTRVFFWDAHSSPATSTGYIHHFNMPIYLDGTKYALFESGEGYLFMTDGVHDPVRFTYNPDTDTISISTVFVVVRDYWGLDDGLTTIEFPNTLSTSHNYNLQNQGWPSAKITAYEASQGAYPSNAQQWFLGRKDDNTFDPAQLAEMDFGSTPAPKGRVLVSLFDRSTSRNGWTGLSTPTDTDATRPSACAFAFQRLWLAGMQSEFPLDLATSPNLTGMVLYSRVIRDRRDFGQFYSDADPSSEVDSELVDTDGGFLMIPDSGKIHRLVSIGHSILVLAENGVWEIRGGTSGFTATDHQVIKVSSFGALAPGAVVKIESDVMYWNKGGIYHLTQDENGFLISQNITENSIQTLYNALDLTTKANAIGAYDPVNRKVMWMYNDDNDEYDGAAFRNRYNKELVLDLVLQAWNKNSISAHDEPSPYIAGYVSMPDFLLRQEGVRSRGDSVTKYVVIQFTDPETDSAAVSFAYYRQREFRDWKSSDGVGTSFNSYVLTGADTMGDTARNKQAPYVFTHMQRTEMNAVADEVTGEAVPDNPSGLLMQAQWGWTVSGSSGKWSDPQQVYRLRRPFILEVGEPIDYGESVITNRTRVRGSGRALSLLFSSDGDKDFYLYGWTIKYTGKEHV